MVDGGFLSNAMCHPPSNILVASKHWLQVRHFNCVESFGFGRLNLPRGRRLSFTPSLFSAPVRCLPVLPISARCHRGRLAPSRPAGLLAQALRRHAAAATAPRWRRNPNHRRRDRRRIRPKAPVMATASPPHRTRGHAATGEQRGEASVVLCQIAQAQKVRYFDDAGIVLCQLVQTAEGAVLR